jgi:predicted transcriptional regulator
MDEEIDYDYLSRKKKRTSSMDTHSDYDEIINTLNQLNINSNETVLHKILKKMNGLEKKIDEMQKIYIKMDNFEKKMEKILIEKDYVIDNLKDEIEKLRSDNKELTETVYSSSKNDYFY